MSATADATHFGGSKGTVSIEDCLFEGMGDDGVNIKSGLYLTVRQRVDDHTVLATIEPHGLCPKTVERGRGHRLEPV